MSVKYFTDRDFFIGLGESSHVKYLCHRFPKGTGKPYFSLVMFYRPGCPACTEAYPNVQKLASETSKVHVFMFDVQRHRSFITDVVRNGVRNLPPEFPLPYITFFKDGMPFQTYDMKKGVSFSALWDFVQGILRFLQPALEQGTGRPSACMDGRPKVEDMKIESCKRDANGILSCNLVPTGFKKPEGSYGIPYNIVCDDTRCYWKLGAGAAGAPSGTLAKTESLLLLSDEQLMKFKDAVKKHEVSAKDMKW